MEFSATPVLSGRGLRNALEHDDRTGWACVQHWRTGHACVPTWWTISWYVVVLVILLSFLLVKICVCLCRRVPAESSSSSDSATTPAVSGDKEGTPSRARVAPSELRLRLLKSSRPSQ